MPGLIIGGDVEPTPFVTINYLDNPTLRLGAEDRRLRRTPWVRALTLHTTAGLPKDPGDARQTLKPGFGMPTRAAARINNWWKQDGRCAGAHLLVDFDGTVAQLADLKAECTFHGGPVNDVSIGVEIYQDPTDASMYDGQLDVVVELVDWLTKRFKIQRQIPTAYRGLVIPRLAAGGEDVVGVYGHRDVTSTRGLGDPGDYIFTKLKDGGYEVVDFLHDGDKVLWQKRQLEYGIHASNADGVPGVKTTKIFERSGLKHGLYVSRPRD